MTADHVEPKLREERGARRLLDVFAKPRERPRPGLMHHELASVFASDGWDMADFRAATHFAYHEKWIGLDANFYVLTDKGRDEYRKGSLRAEAQKTVHLMMSID